MILTMKQFALGLDERSCF